MACKITYKGIRYNSLEELYADAYKKSKSLESTKQNLRQQQVKRDSQNNETLYQNNTNQSNNDYVASEKTIRDLAARISDRIGASLKIENDVNKQYKGKLENGIAYVNLAYATLDTPIHEILAHPIIRAIKKKNDTKAYYEIESQTDKYVIVKNQQGGSKVFNTLQEANDFIKRENTTTLYQSLLKELETSRGKEVLDRIKRDYKSIPDKEYLLRKIHPVTGAYSNIKTFNSQEELDNYKKNNILTGNWNEFVRDKFGDKIYTLEEQQEEAIVELLGLYTADRLDKVKDGKLISLLKRLLKEMKAFMKQLLGQKEVEIDKLPDNMTLGDIADLLAYSNSKLILPGNEVVYITPDNQTFKTYQEASNHISDLAKSVEDVDLTNVKINTSMPDSFEVEVLMGEDEPSNILKFTRENGQWYISDNWTGKNKIEESEVIKYYQDSSGNYFGAKQNNINSFIEKNKQYEQSKEIIEEWKKVNGIKYDPEEVYSRGQGFYSVVGAYSSFDAELMFQNLLDHIQDNKKAGGEFTISAFTKPVDKQIGHLEGGGGKIKFKIFPKSEDIKWAANTDVYSGSVWDASEKVSQNTKSELIGVSYTKFPSLTSVYSVQPNLASIIDNLSHHHNELGIELTDNNFRLEYDDDVPYSTKRLVDNINSILDQKYGKLVEPEINTSNKKELKYSLEIDADKQGIFDTIEEAERIGELGKQDGFDYLIKKVYIQQGKQPTKTKDNLKESIESVKFKMLLPQTTEYWIPMEEYDNATVEEWTEDGETFYKDIDDNVRLVRKGLSWRKELLVQPKEKEYTSQAEINIKIAALKKGIRKFPRSLIRSKVINTSVSSYLYIYDDFSFQKIPSQQVKPGVKELFESNPELANAVYEAVGLKTLENSRLEKDIKELIKDREDIPSSIFLSYLVDNNLIPKIQEYITSIGYRGGEWNELYGRLTLNYSISNTKSEIAKLMSHELMHALSLKYITSYEALRQPDFKEYIDKVNENEKIKGTNRKIELINLTREQVDAFDNLVRIKEKVFDFIKAGKFNKNEKLTNANFGSLNYAFSELDKKEDIHEFISEAFSNPILIDVLKQIPTEGNKSNLFKEFIKALKIILGFNDESIIEDILYYSEKAFINEALKESNTKKQQAQQLYSQYLDTIFPDSKVKDIVYHNTNEQFEKFKTIPVAKFFTKSSVGGRKYRVPVVLNMSNPEVFSEFKEDDEMTYGLSEMYAKNKERDSIINGTEGKTRTEYIVFEPEQIHILGSKQDIEGFNKFVNQPASKPVSTKPEQIPSALQDAIDAMIMLDPTRDIQSIIDELTMDGTINQECN